MRAGAFYCPADAESTHLADAGLKRVSPGGRGRNISFLRIAAILFDGSRAFPARTRAYFSLVGKVGNTHPGHLNTHRGGPLSMGSLPYVPLLHDDTKGASPLWNPPSQSCGLSGDPSRFDLRGGNESRLTPRFSPFAKTLVRRTPGENPNETCAPFTGPEAEAPLIDPL